MPRPRLHFTAEEKREATRKKHAKYYEKHKSEIQHKRAEKKRKQQERESRKGSRIGNRKLGRRGNLQNPSDNPQSKGPQSQRPELTIPEHPRVLAARKWLRKADRVQRKILEAYGQHPTHHGYCDDLYHCYLARWRETSEDEPSYTEPFDSAHRDMEGYTRLFTDYKLKLGEEVGKEDEYWRVNDMETKAFIAASAIGDLLCEALMGIEYVKKKYERGQFSFQKARK
ncbi:hypothetical protein PQX77_021214 [Marasmius sp. AFHP31]|nr:hypothetical protein PQX77_021214 [Marasmius sp. AFHP31]